MLRNRMLLSDAVSGVGWGGVGMMTFFELAHMVDATQQDASLGLAHMLDATQQDGAGQLDHAPGDAYDITKDHEWLFE